MRVLLTLSLLVFQASCDHSMYTRDGVTDGDTFYLSPQAMAESDPVLQSWVTYSLGKSACQLELGGSNPARNSSYGCEFMARQLLLDRWDRKQADGLAPGDSYLDTLADVRDAGFLDEYVVYYFGRDNWRVPAEVDLDGFEPWRREHLKRHRPVTRLTGSWSYPRPERPRDD